MGKRYYERKDAWGNKYYEEEDKKSNSDVKFTPSETLIGVAYLLILYVIVRIISYITGW
jgi:hypothetical protein